MTASITLNRTPQLVYVLRLGDTCLIHSHRLSQWCGHAPVLEEDIAMSNMALDLLGQSRALLTLAGQLQGNGGHTSYDEDQLAFLRNERDYFNLTLAELPNGVSADPGQRDFAFTTLRGHALAVWLRLLWQHLTSSSNSTLAAIAAKAVKEARYHEEHTADWVVRLGDGTAESKARMQRGLQRLWPYTAELFAHDAVDDAAVAQGLGPASKTLRDEWLRAVLAVYNRATLVPPASTPFMSTGRDGKHGESMGFILAEMQHLQRSFPGGVW
jgi:ring-1,2-phenylacetyl-CoA epoxidase subunit PaaC